MSLKLGGVLLAGGLSLSLAGSVMLGTAVAESRRKKATRPQAQPEHVGQPEHLEHPAQADQAQAAPHDQDRDQGHAQQRPPAPAGTRSLDQGAAAEAPGLKPRYLIEGIATRYMAPSHELAHQVHLLARFLVRPAEHDMLRQAVEAMDDVLAVENLLVGRCVPNIAELPTKANIFGAAARRLLISIAKTSNETMPSETKAAAMGEIVRDIFKILDATTHNMQMALAAIDVTRL